MKRPFGPNSVPLGPPKSCRASPPHALMATSTWDPLVGLHFLVRGLGLGKTSRWRVVPACRVRPSSPSQSGFRSWRQVERNRLHRFAEICANPRTASSPTIHGNKLRPSEHRSRRSTRARPFCPHKIRGSWCFFPWTQSIGRLRGQSIPSPSPRPFPSVLDARPFSTPRQCPSASGARWISSSRRSPPTSSTRSSCRGTALRCEPLRSLADPRRTSIRHP